MRRSTTWAVAVAVAPLALAAAGCRRSESAAGEPPPVAAAPERADGHIDPGPYRAEIEATEALLYTDREIGDADWRELSRALLELHNAIVFRDTSVAARETSRRLFFFSAQVDATSAPKHTSDELVVMRGVWEKIRADQFTDVDWFRASHP